MIKKQPAAVIQMIINYNFLFLFLEEISAPCIRDLLNLLMNPEHTEHKIPNDVLNLCWKYCKNTNFFQDLGEKMVKGTPTVHIKIDKLEREYKPYDKRIIKIQGPDLNFRYANLDNTTTLYDNMFDIDYNRRVDIDRIMDLIDGKLTIDISKLHQSDYDAEKDKNSKFGKKRHSSQIPKTPLSILGTPIQNNFGLLKTNTPGMGATKNDPRKDLTIEQTTSESLSDSFKDMNEDSS